MTFVGALFQPFHQRHLSYAQAPASPPPTPSFLCSSLVAPTFVRLHCAQAYLEMTAIPLAAGTTCLMWIAEEITRVGIGQGTSVVISMSIIAAYLAALRGAGPALLSGELPLWVAGAVVAAMGLLSVRGKRIENANAPQARSYAHQKRGRTPRGDTPRHPAPPSAAVALCLRLCALLPALITDRTALLFPLRRPPPWW